MECDRETGRCFDGCQTGWGNPTCSTSTVLFFAVLNYDELLNFAPNGCDIIFPKRAYILKAKYLPGKAYC